MGLELVHGIACRLPGYSVETPFPNEPHLHATYSDPGRPCEDPTSAGRHLAAASPHTLWVGKILLSLTWPRHRPAAHAETSPASPAIDLGGVADLVEGRGLENGCRPQRLHFSFAELTAYDDTHPQKRWRQHFLSSARAHVLGNAAKAHCCIGANAWIFVALERGERRQITQNVRLNVRKN